MGPTHTLSIKITFSPFMLDFPPQAHIIIIIIIMYIYHALINALSAHMIHINLNMIFYTHVEHSPTKTIYINKLYCYYCFMYIYEPVPERAQVKWDIWIKNQILNYLWLSITYESVVFQECNVSVPPYHCHSEENFKVEYVNIHND